MDDSDAVIRVETGGGAYDVTVGTGLIDQPECFPADVLGAEVFVVTNETVGPLYADRLTAALGSRRITLMTLPDGEEHKTLESFARIIDAMVAARMHRDATVIGLGGGVIGDMAGFAAASYQRGVAVVQVPTTLLAQVDAAVGGKTGVNHPGGKNLIGAFHQPRAVIADVAVLDTLPEREYRAGLAEVVKYGAGLDADFFSWIEANAQALLQRDAEALRVAVCRSCEAKAAVVQQDEREAGRRALLNLGHTFGHAIEVATGYGSWLHGEAVAAGMVLAGRLSGRLGLLPADDAARLENLLSVFGLPVAPPPISADRLLDLMRMDKKVLSGRLRLILMKGLGDSFVEADCPEGEVRAVLHAAAAG
ncbi:MAG: 3-dehydroquinate synthase [Chromatiales bacterium]|jgi:3-dehydroquinate synthase|nr:3-dehydroquinate synthase [Chromatiales bacterium]